MVTCTNRANPLPRNSAWCKSLATCVLQQTPHSRAVPACNSRSTTADHSADRAGRSACARGPFWCGPRTFFGRTGERTSIMSHKQQYESYDEMDYSMNEFQQTNRLEDSNR